jgi:plastocyanin domain-containing protein
VCRSGTVNFKEKTLKNLFFLLLLPISLLGEAYAVNDAKVFDKPQREHSIILTESGYYPDQIVAFEGERLKLFVTSTIDKPECLVVEDHKIFLEATKGKVASGESVLAKAGTYKFYCPSSHYQGKLVVLEKKVKKDKPKRLIPSEDVAREIASEKPSYWTPRNYD